MKLLQYLFACALALSLGSCTKNFLDKSPSKGLVIPDNIDELQALLDNYTFMNIDYPSLGEMSSEGFTLSSDYLMGLDTYIQNAYRWNKEIYNGTEQYFDDWTYSYRRVFYANSALEGIDKIKRSAENENAWNNVKGSALFFRAYSFYNLLQLYAVAYDPATASTDPGIPLRLTSSIDERSVRSTVEQSYRQVITDLSEALSFLPVTPSGITRPAKAAAFALLARTYLLKSDYANAKRFADSCLSYNNKLLDYNGLTFTGQFAPTMPLPENNPEMIFYTLEENSSAVVSARQELADSYEAHDLRKGNFVDFASFGTIYAGYYAGNFRLFNGLATDEVYLIRAECNARLNNTSDALNDLNVLLQKRWDTAYFVPVAITDPAALLARIIDERRKELVARGIRWTDMRRLNKEAAFRQTFTRTDGVSTFTLPPNDPRYVFPIPPTVITLTGMQQNFR